MTRPLLSWFLAALLFAPLSACEPPPDVPDDDDDADDDDDDDDDDGPYVPSGPWSELSYAERITFMEQLVMPAMREIFVGENAASYPGLSCETCHGSYAVSNDYRMPNGLYPLSLDDFPLTNSPDHQVAQAAVFMEEEVKPIMADLLGLEPFPTGDFGCFSCHELD